MPASWPSRPDPFPPLYAILDVDAAATRGLAPLSLLDIWLDAGVRLIQLRAKHLSSGPFLELAQQAVAAARRAHATLVINDRIDVARMSGAAGVHLGQDDVPVDAGRRQLADGGIGVSTHNLVQLREAIATSADYIAMGPVFQTTTKDRPDPAVGLDGVAAARRELGDDRRPLVAIGGITLENAGSVIAAGADTVAVIADLLTADPAGRARAFLARLAVR